MASGKVRHSSGAALLDGSLTCFAPGSRCKQAGPYAGKIVPLDGVLYPRYTSVEELLVCGALASEWLL